MIALNLPGIQPTAVIAQPPHCGDLVKKIALKCLKELAATLAINTVIACFVTTPAGLSLLVTAALMQLTVSLFFHSVGAFASYKALQEGATRGRYENLLSICRWFTGTNFALFTGYNAQTLIHESGHAAASLLTYAKPRPLIEIYPFTGGVTQFNKSKLSLFGKKMGAPASNCFLIASGPGLTLLVSAILLAVGVATHKKRPELSKYLIMWGLIDFLNHAHYAYSALGAPTWNLAHDFVRLSIFGLSPITATVGLIAAPIVIAVGVHYWMRSTEPRLVTT